MTKTKEAYTIDEAAEMLHTNRTTILVLLSGIRKDLDPQHVKKIRTWELENLYQMIKPDAT